MASETSADVVIVGTGVVGCLVAEKALDAGLSGAIIDPAAYFSKHPPKQIEDREARQLVEAYISKYGHKD